MQQHWSKSSPHITSGRYISGCVCVCVNILLFHLATTPVKNPYFRDFMDPTMDNTKHILNYLMPIIERVNPEVHDFMQQ